MSRVKAVDSGKAPWQDRVRRSWPCFVSAALLLLAFPPFNLGLLVFVALVPWILSLRDSTGRQAWQSGYLLGFLYGMGQLFWVAQLTAKWVGSIGMGIIPWLIACSLYAIYFGWTAVLIRHCWNRNWPWAIPLAWAGIEVFRSFIPMFAFPWGLLANPLWPYPPLIQNAHFGSIYLVSAWVMLLNVIFALALKGDNYLRVRPYAYVALAGVVFSILELGTSVPSTPLTVTIGQPGVDMAFGTQENQTVDLRRNVNAIVDRARADGTNLVVLPEGIAEAPTMPPNAVFKIPTDIPIIFGGRRHEDPTFQSAFAYDGKKWQFVDKTRLVVFGEFVPFREYIPFITNAFHLQALDLTPGKHGVGTVTLNGLKIGPVVCFEALFPDVTFTQSLRDVRLLAVIGIDDWYMDGNAPDQIRAASIWRAVETGLPLVRSTTLGYTLACDSHGRILAQLPLRKPGALKVQMAIPDHPTVLKVAAAFPALCMVFSFALPWLPKDRKSTRKSN